MSKGQLYVISGPSGVGKGTICRRLIEEMKLKFSISMTTRESRMGEKHGEDYYFISHEEFSSIRDNDGFLEHAEVYGNFYGTPKLQTEEALSAGMDVLLDVDTQGAINIKKACDSAVFIFILPPSVSELRRRIEARATETEESLNRRLAAAISEISFLSHYDYFIVNDDLEIAASQAKAIIQAERLKVPVDKEELESLLAKYKEGI